jgi:uncharacterized protein YdbL (DUF1318 family)
MSMRMGWKGVLAALALVLAVAAWATPTKEHLALVKGLKNKGLVGEDSRGFLAFVTDKKVAEEVVKAVNADRLKAYERIAAEQKASVEQVGRNRAVQLAAEASPGEWIQDGDGKWRQKK